MQANIKIGRIWGIPIGFNYSWFLIFALVTFSLAVGLLPDQFGSLSTGMIWALAVITSLLFFASVLSHELGHAFFALRNNVPVKAITLFLFGGVAQITREPRTAGAEFRIAIAGPLVSLGLGALFGAIYLLASDVAVIAAPALWLARINLILALFNMIPGFPLDGGRVLRSVIWQVTGNELRATRIASLGGQVVAFSFIGIGVLSLFTGNVANGIWLAFIGFYLRNAAVGSQAYAEMQEALRGITANDVMTRNLTLMPGHMPASSLLGFNYLGQEQRAFFVAEASDIRGMVTLTDAANVPESQRSLVPVNQLMKPVSALTSIRADAELTEALQIMGEANVKQLPVIEHGNIIGLLTREQIMRLLQHGKQFRLAPREPVATTT